MKAKNLKTMAIMVFALTFIILSGCASNRVNLVDSGKVLIERVDSENICISRTNVYQDGDQLEITGAVKRRRSTIFDGGHVHIAIINPQGEVLEEVRTSYSPRIIRRKGRRESYFSVRLPIKPPEGSVVRVIYHKHSTSTGRHYDS
jgi:hypothetical protein